MRLTNCYILSLKWSEGKDTLVWYRPNASGYTTNLREAGLWPAGGGVTVAVPVAKAWGVSRTVVSVPNYAATLERLIEGS